MTIEHPELHPASIMASGLKRISALTEKYGITSPEVFAACERWGGILDDVNFPDDTCSKCGHPVTYMSEVQAYYHVETKSKHCHNVAAAVATPKGVGSGRLAKKPTNPLIKDAGWERPTQEMNFRMGR